MSHRPTIISNIWRAFSACRSWMSLLALSAASRDAAITVKRTKQAQSVTLCILSILLFSVNLCPQIQGNLPNVVDAVLDRAAGGVSGNITWPENIQIGDTVVLCYNTQPGVTYSLSDSLDANPWTLTAHTTTPAPQANTDVWMAYKKFTSTGAMTLTTTVVSGSGFIYLQGARFTGLGTLDGSVTTATVGAPAGSIGTMSTVQTTTNNQALLVSCGGGSSNPVGHLQLPGNTEHLANQVDALPSLAPEMTMLHTGVAGSQTATLNIWGGSSTFAMQTLAFAPSTILIADTNLPDAGTGVAYSAQLHCVGGTAGQTYSIVSGALPTGLSLNTATGAITGTPSGTTQTIGFACTDGTVTSATQNLTINVGPILGVPSTRTLSGSNPYTMNVQCGSTIVIFARGDKYVDFNGFVQAATGVNNKISDTFNSPVRRLVGRIPGNNSWPLVAYIVGPVTTAGTDTITVQNSLGGNTTSAVRTSLAVEVTGASVWDIGAAVSALTNSATGSFAASYTTLVNNTMLLVASDSNSSVGLSISAPFSPISSGGDVTGTTLYSASVISTPQSVTATTSFTGGSLNETAWDSLIIPLRPALPVPGCPVNFGTGEKFRRQIW